MAPHATRQCPARRFSPCELTLCEVVVIAHQAIGQHLRIKARERLCQDRQKPVTVLVVQEDRLAPGNSMRSGRAMRANYAWGR